MERVEKILSLPLYQEYLGRNREKEIDRKFCVHNWQHFIDVARLTYILLLEDEDQEKIKQELGNRKNVKELSYAAALLHDIGKWQEYETGEDHALVSAKLARALLLEVGFSLPESELISQAIEEHRTASDPQTTLGYYLKKADKLARLCRFCLAQDECYKFSKMETAHCYLVY